MNGKISKQISNESNSSPKRYSLPGIYSIDPSTPDPFHRKKWKAADLLMAKLPPPPLVYLIGEKFVGKRLVAQSLAYAAITGGEWLGLQMSSSMSVLWVDTNTPKKNVLHQMWLKAKAQEHEGIRALIHYNFSVWRPKTLSHLSEATLARKITETQAEFTIITASSFISDSRLGTAELLHIIDNTFSGLLVFSTHLPPSAPKDATIMTLTRSQNIINVEIDAPGIANREVFTTKITRDYFS